MSFGIFDPEPLNCNIDSVKKICGSSDQVAVYGFSHCLYGDLKLQLKGVARNIHDTRINNLLSFKNRVTLEGRNITGPVKSGRAAATTHNQKTRRQCKGFLTNLMYENVQRKTEKKPLIPLLFVIDINDNDYLSTPETILSKEDKLNQLVTHAELRRAYKLCTDPSLDPEIRAVAQETLKFVKVVQTDGKSELEAIDAPWKSKDWEAAWAKRKKESKSKPKADDWRKEMNAHVAVSRLVDDCLAGAVAEVAAEKANPKK